MRVLTSPAETGAVTLCLPQDTQTEAFDYPAAFFEERTWHVPRAARGCRGDGSRGRRPFAAVARPLIIAGGGVLYSEASEALRQFAEATGIGVAETQAGKGALGVGSPARARRHRRDRQSRRQPAARATRISSSPSARG